MTTKKPTTKGKGRGSKSKARTVTPEQEAAIRARVDADSAVAHPLAMEAYTNVYGLYLENAGALKLARRIAEIYAEAVKRGDREDYIMAAADEVLTSGGEHAMLSSPASAFFVAFFVAAVRDLSPEHNALAEVKSIVTRYDAGVTLREQAEEEEARRGEVNERHKAEQLEKPEPKDKLSDEWRYWKLRQVEHAFGPERMNNPNAYAEAWAYCNTLLAGCTKTPTFTGQTTSCRYCRNSSSRGSP
jgi:hypothetical protein